MTTEIYLDANATSPVLPAALAAADEAMRERFGNPSSTHAAGLKARAMLDAVRACARRVLGAGQGRIIFTSGATEGIHTAVLSALCALRERRAAGARCGSILLYGATEHKAVPEALAHWNRLLGTGLALRALPVGADGRHDLAALRVLAPEAAMVCTMAANNETGVVSDLDGIARVLADSGSAALWMVDSVQALGKLALDLAASRIDYAPFSGHKLYAPKGVGMLYVRAGAPFTPLMTGGGQESGQRCGTENMAGIAALGAVLEAFERGGTFRGHAELSAFRQRLATALRAALPDLVFNMDFEQSLPTTLNFSVPGFAAKELLDLFDAAGVRVSSGSACSSAEAAPSYVLEAMQRPDWCCGAAVRMSFGPLADEAFIDAACRRIAACGAALRSSGLVAAAPAAACRGGVTQLTVDNDSTWLVADADSARCVIVDPHPELVGRIVAMVRAHALQVRAVVASHEGGHVAQARALLLGELAGVLDGAAGSDALGWPDTSEIVMLGNGLPAAGLMLGRQLLVRLKHPEHCATGIGYLLGEASGAGLAAADVRFAFSGMAMLPGIDETLPAGMLHAAVQRLASLVNRETVVCPARVDGHVLCTTLATEALGSGPLAQLLAMQPGLARAALPPMDSVMNLEPAALERFLATHPDALLVDVREPCEHAASGTPAWLGREVQSVPLSRLAHQAAAWLRGEQRPLVLFCRSGNRSARAAQCLHRLGYVNAWQLVGGLALSDALLSPLALAA